MTDLLTPSVPAPTASITLPISSKLCLDLLTAAFEGGSAYWLACHHEVRDAELNVTSIIGCYDREDESTTWPDVTIDTMILGIQRIVKPEFDVNTSIRTEVLDSLAHPEDGGWDSDTADAVLQAGMFNELVYG